MPQVLLVVHVAVLGSGPTLQHLQQVLVLGPKTGSAVASTCPETRGDAELRTRALLSRTEARCAFLVLGDQRTRS